MEKILEGLDFLNFLWTLDEANSILKKISIQSQMNSGIPSKLVKKLLSPFTPLSVIMGPFFFMETGWTMPVPKERFIEVLKIFKRGAKYPLSVAHKKVLVLANGARPHTLIMFRDWLKEKFGDSVTSFNDFELTPHTPDLNQKNLLSLSISRTKYTQGNAGSSQNQRKPSERI